MAEETKIVEAEVVEKGISFGSQTAADPTQVMAMASKIATPLAKLIDEQKLYVMIQSKPYVTVEGWTTLGAMLGIVPREVSVRLLEDGNYEATVELYHMETGQIRGRASALCGTDRPWNNRDDYAKRSMAITRATGKAFRLSYSWIMKMAGYQVTPAEEMPSNMQDQAAPKKSKAPAKSASKGPVKIDGTYQVRVNVNGDKKAISDCDEDDLTFAVDNLRVAVAKKDSNSELATKLLEVAEDIGKEKGFQIPPF